MKYFSLLLIGFWFSMQIVYAQTPAERYQFIRNSLENRDWTAAAISLQDFRQFEPKLFGINNFDYLLARTAERRQDLATAIVFYQNVVKRGSILSEYALWHLASIARGMNNPALERLYLHQLLTIAPNSLLMPPAQIRLANSFFESGDYNAVINFNFQTSEAKPQSKTKPETPKSGNEKQTQRPREFQLLRGNAFLKNNLQQQAREVFTQLILNLPNPSIPDDFALEAVKGLDLLDGGAQNFGKTAPQLAEVEHFRRAKIYQFNRDFAQARLHFQAIVERYPNSVNAADSMLQIGRTLTQENRFDESIMWFERVQAQFPNTIFFRDALNIEASAFSRLKKTDESITRYRKLIELTNDKSITDFENPDRPYQNLIDVLRDDRQITEAFNWIKKTRERFKGKYPSAVALFTKIRMHLSNNELEQALRDLDELQNEPDLGGTKVPGGTTKSEVAFLKAFVLEQLDRHTEAINAYLAIPDGRNEYYGWQATERLLALAQNETAKPLIEGRLNIFRLTANQALAKSEFETARQVATNALRLTENPEIKRELLEIARRAYSQLPNYKNVPVAELMKFGRQSLLTGNQQITTYNSQSIANELLFLGLYDEATPELERSLSQNLNSDVSASNENEKPETKPAENKSKTKISVSNPSYTLAVFYKRGDLANRSIGYIEPLWRNVPADYLLELAPREAVELLYPTPYNESLQHFAIPRKVDPRFALSIMRQESRFNPDIKSVAAARGLMQFISSTSNDIAKQLNMDNFHSNDLYHPPTAILFGSQYLSNLQRQFQGELPAVAGAYNGGELNVERWIKRSYSNDPVRYVPEFLFAQSKDYVYKVMANYRVYKMLYDEQLKSK